ncbi:MAG: adenylate kinase [Planctomycetes bacterium]|nr:adenylate kinase [Planctomycetota bacterium]MCW8136470.1 adenylate kinase [Planctomycetota bacterium]
MILVFLGPPGVGKGTQAAKLAAEFKLPHISTGDIFRDHLKRETELGRKAKEFMNAGKLVPDELTVSLVIDRISRTDCEKGYILDGFPRNVKQGEALDKALAQRGEQVTAALNFDAPRQTVIDRIAGRALKEGRVDDTPETVKKRLEVYDAETGPLTPFYREKGVLHEFDATGTIDQIYGQLKDRVLSL